MRFKLTGAEKKKKEFKLERKEELRALPRGNGEEQAAIFATNTTGGDERTFQIRAHRARRRFSVVGFSQTMRPAVIISPRGISNRARTANRARP